MNLKPIQIQQANDLIKRYRFCSLETQKLLVENEFFAKQNVLHYIVFPDDDPEISIPFVGVREDIDYYAKNDYDYVLFPQLEYVFECLPDEVLASDESRYYHKRLTSYGIGYGTDTHNEFFVSTETTITDAACKLWLQLKEKNLL